MSNTHPDNGVTQPDDMRQWHELTLELLTSMGEMHGSSSQSRDISSILNVSLKYINRIIDFSSLGIMTVNEEDASFELISWTPESNKKTLQRHADMLIESGKFAWAIQQSRPVAVELKHSSDPLMMHVLSTKTRVRGMFIGIHKASIESLSPTNLQLLSVILHNCAQAIESASLYNLIHEQNQMLEEVAYKRTRELEYHLGHDELTGLPNRILFQDRIEQAINNARRHKNKLSVLLLDIDLFSRINETMGHSAGDALLKALANRLNNVLRSTDTVCRIGNHASNITLSRLGGDEFSILITDLEDVDSVINIIRRLFESTSDPFSINGQEVFITLSIGISLFPTDSETTETLMQQSDIAMHHAKVEGRNNYQFYSEDINTISYQHLVLESQLRHAIKNDEFVLYYQPQVDVLTQKVIGAEALIRWIKEDGTLVPPFDFIPVAEHSGQIVAIGEWVLNEACRQAREWFDAGLEQKVSVNISVQQFKDERLLDKIKQAVNGNKLPPRLLELEITESTIMHNRHSAIQTLEAIHELGISLSIDDFGTGYSSLSYLKRFPIDSLKIDRSFVQDIEHDNDDAAIVTAIIAMAHSLHLHVVAEGVEEPYQVQFLRDLDCEIIQGFLYSKPIPAKDYLEFLKTPPSY